MITLTCEQCGKPYETKRYMATKSERHFCGLTCYGEWQQTHRKGHGSKQVEVTCDNCGKAFTKQPSVVAEHNFCGRKCFAEWRSATSCGSNNPAWLGGHLEYRGENWRTQRVAARARDNDTCQDCGKHGRNLPVHHVRPFRLFADYKDANQLDNLITLCGPCHSKADMMFWRNHPELGPSTHFPNVYQVHVCERCGKEFTSASGAARLCGDCHTVRCENCGKEFYSERTLRAKVRFCSNDCRREAITYKPQVCAGCGATYTPTRPHTKYCTQSCFIHRANPRRAWAAKRSKT